MLVTSISIEPRFLYIKVKIARPMATSAAATVKIKNTKICPARSELKNEKAIKLVLTAAKINSTHIKIIMMLVLFIKIPAKPIQKTIELRIK